MGGLKNPKQKGYRHEVECVDGAKKYGLDAVRAFGSDGRALGEKSDVDVVIVHPGLCQDDRFKKLKLQAKSRAFFPKYFSLGNADLKVFKANRQRSMALVDYEWLMECLSRVR